MHFNQLGDLYKNSTLHFKLWKKGVILSQPFFEMNRAFSCFYQTFPVMSIITSLHTIVKTGGNLFVDIGHRLNTGSCVMIYMQVLIEVF